MVLRVDVGWRKVRCREGTIYLSRLAGSFMSVLDKDLFSTLFGLFSTSLGRRHNALMKVPFVFMSSGPDETTV